MADAVIIADVVRGFLEPGNPLYCGDAARRIIPNVRRLLEQEASRGSKLFYVCDEHEPDDPEFELFPPHCVAGSHETELIPEVAPFAGEIIGKKGYSAFFNTALDERLRRLRPGKLVICGVCTDICVLHTVSDARNRGYEVEVPVDCVASFDLSAHRFALSHIEKVLGGKLTRVSTASVPLSKFEPSASVLSGETADVYFLRSVDILRSEGVNPVATMEVFPARAGILCGMREVHALLDEVLPKDNRAVWSLSEGDSFERKEVVLRMTAPYQSYAIYETAYLGMLSQCSGWATAARECVEAAGEIPIVGFGARHVHPTVAGLMDYAAIVGGCNGCSSVSGASLAGIAPSGTMPHALIIAMGDTARATLAFDRLMPAEVARVALVDTFKDEPEEAVAVARALEGRLQGVRLDTPSERGRVTADLVKETRARLDLAGFKGVKIFVSGGVDPERIHYFRESGAPIDALGVGSYISGAHPIDFTADLHELDGRPVAKRGRIPGITQNPRLKRIM
ncbi:MAG: nicotinate phosphoribosyltransferase [Chloroflexi bacterium]|nr:nicotinate phosphoribosyltransferase [Chloroflexota bacterium]